MGGVAGSQPIVLPKLGGLYTFLKPVDVPSGYSPNLQNVRFLPRAFFTRPGFTKRVSGNIFGTQFNGLTQFITNSSQKLLVLLDNIGVLYTNSNGTAADTWGFIPPFNPGSLLKSQTAFGRTFLAGFQGPPNVSSPFSPGGPIRHWDGNIDSPILTPAAATVANSPISGTITAGTHNLVVYFEMVGGSLSPGSPISSWVASGAVKGLVTNLPIGPLGCVARRIAITTSTDHNTFWFLPTFKVNDNVSTSFTIDGSDAILTQQGYPLQSLYTSSAGGPRLLSPLSPDGPGAAPTVVDDTTVYSPVNISTITEFGSVATVTTTAPHGFQPGQTVIIAGSSVSGYNITETIKTAPTPTTFTYLPGVSGLANASGGTATLTGNISIGVHQVQVVFETRWGYLTLPSPTTSWQAAGGLGAIVSNIPIGPWYVIARRILVTLSGGADFFYISQNRIGDNSTTSIRIDFTDIILAAGSNFDYLARNYSPMDSYGVAVYNGRLVTWGGLNTLKGNNFGFDGGWNFNDGSPGGWAPDTNYAGGVRESNNVFCGEAWLISGDGATNIRGQIKNASIQPLLQPNTAYTVSIRAALSNSASLTSPSIFINVELFSPSIGLLSPTFQIPSTSLKTTAFLEFQGVILNGVSAIPSDTVIRVYMSGTATVSTATIVDHLRVWPTNTKFEASVVRFSNPLDPETFDGVNGLVQIAKDNGEFVVGCAQLRSFFYIFKERSMHTAYDDGTNPPSLWFTRVVDSTIGTASPNSVTSSDTFIVTMWRSGAYMYSGGRPMKISQEIQTTWEDFVWEDAWQNSILLDTQNKNIFFFGVMGNNGQVLNSFMLDYSEGIGTEDDPAGRKWGFDIYPFSINAAIKFETDTNEQTLYMASTNIFENVGTDDNGTTIDSLYDTAFVKAGDHGQDLFVGCTYFAEGNGPIIVSMRGLDDVVIDVLVKNITLTPNPGKQFEMWGNLESERAKIRFESSGDNTQMTVKGAIIYAQPNFMEQRPA